MKKQLLLLLAILLHLSGGIAQFTNSDLQNKYWTSRNRLKKLFVTARSGPGNGIPTQGIELSGTPDYIYTRQLLASNGTDSLIPDSLWGRNLANIVNTEPIGKIGSDNPIITIGEYLSVLSTEYWLLVYYGKNNSEEMTALKNEIYYALAAVDRLDGTAEPYFKEQLPINYNGFLRRDDVEDFREERVNNYYFQPPVI